MIDQRIVKICEQTLNNDFQFTDDLNNIWPKETSGTIYDEIREDIEEYIEHLPTKSGKIDKNSFEFLSVYVDYWLGKKEISESDFKDEKKRILGKENLTKKQAEEEIKKI